MVVEVAQKFLQFVPTANKIRATIRKHRLKAATPVGEPVEAIEEPVSICAFNDDDVNARHGLDEQDHS